MELPCRQLDEEREPHDEGVVGREGEDGDVDGGLGGAQDDQVLDDDGEDRVGGVGALAQRVGEEADRQQGGAVGAHQGGARRDAGGDDGVGGVRARHSLFVAIYGT